MSVALAVITYRRAAELGRLLDSLQRQEPGPDERWTARIVVVDNDPERSARSVVEAASGRWPVLYAVEMDPGIPSARQTSVELCLEAQAIVFVDDDEVAPPGWLDRLVGTLNRTSAGVVTGPVRGVLPAGAPRWAVHSDTFDSRGRHRTGDAVAKVYTNNTIVRTAAIRNVGARFEQAFRYTGSSDLHFFRQLRRAGVSMVWDDDAVVEEYVSSDRLTPVWFVRRAFRSGAGDAVSRRLLDPWWRAVPVGLAMGALRVGNGVVLLIAGVTSRRRAVQGVRRVVSGVGTWAGVVGVNYREYRRVDRPEPV